MSEAKHTPGPWYVTAKNAVAPYVVQGLHGEAIARCTSHERSPDDSEHERMAANGRLITASPDLLEAVSETLRLIQDLTDSIRCTDRVQALAEQCTAAIAKATA